MLIVSLIAASLAAFVFLRTKGDPSDPPSSQMAAIRLRNNNKRDDLPLGGGPSLVTWLLIGLTLAAIAAWALRSFTF